MPHRTPLKNTSQNVSINSRDSTTTVTTDNDSSIATTSLDQIGQGSTQTGNVGQTETQTSMDTTTENTLIGSNLDGISQTVSQNADQQNSISDSVSVRQTNNSTSSTTDRTTDRGTAGQVTTTTVRQYGLSAANAQFRLIGNWTEIGASTSRTEAISPGAGSFTQVITDTLNLEVDGGTN